MPSDYAPWSDDAIPVVIVDDARFTLEMLRRVLQSTGFTDLRVAASAEEALAMLRERRAGILVADWLMPEMDGLTLTRHVRQLDEDSDHYTYVILLTAKEGLASLTEAFDSGVDDFINKSPDNQELLARIHAAGRISQLQNDLLAANRQVQQLRREAATENFDPTTGFGNRDYVEAELENLLRHTEGRGGNACILLVRLTNAEALRSQYGQLAVGELLATMAQRLSRGVRPLDRIGAMDGTTFAVLMYQEGGDGCHPNTFRRLHQALKLRAYRTSEGFISAEAAVALCSLDTHAAGTHPTPRRILDVVAAGLPDAQETGLVVKVPWEDAAR